MADAILSSGLICPKGSFDCGVLEVRAARIILIIAYSLEFALAVALLSLTRRRALLYGAVLAAGLYCLSRVTLFALPLYYTLSLMSNGLGGVVLFIDVFPESIYYTFVLLVFLSYRVYARTLFSLRTPEPHSSLLGPTSHFVQRSRTMMLVAGVALVLTTVVCGIATQLWLLRDSTALPSHSFYLKIDPILDSAFLSSAAAILEVFLVYTAYKYPVKLKLAMALALLPGIKGIYGTVEWAIWTLPNLAWMILWLLYFFVTDIVPMAAVLGVLLHRTIVRRKRLSSPLMGPGPINDQRPFLLF